MTYTKAGSGILMVNGTIIASPVDAARVAVVSIGSGAHCFRDQSVAIGAGATSKGYKGHIIGFNTSCDYNYCVGLGPEIGFEGDQSTAMGYGPIVGEYGVAIGSLSLIHI